MVKLSIMILTEFDHPVGLQYINEFLTHNIKINEIIFTQKRDYFSLLKKFKERMGNGFVMPKTKDILKRNRSIPCYFIDDVNSSESVELIKSFSPDLIIQAAVGLIKDELLKVPKIGILNCHPGVFPKYRGCTCVEWAVYNDDPLGCTCHLIDKNIDWGEVIMIEPLSVKRGDSYYDVRRKSLYQCASVMANSVMSIIRKKYTPGKIKLNETDKNYFKPIDDTKMMTVKEKLEKESYKHYID